MAGVAPEQIDVEVAGGRLRVARFGSDGEVVLGLHGITGSSMQLVPVARRLPAGWSVVAPDLRGRGASNHLPGPYGMEAHAEDCAAVLSAVSEGPVVVLGESMGAYVAVVLAARHPEVVARLVLADGGIPLPVPPGLDPDVVLEAVLGPALARLDQVFPSRSAYLEFWRAHPAVSKAWGPEVEAYLDYDLEAVEGGFRSRARPEPVRADGREHIVDPTLVADSLRRVRCPVTLVRAERDLLDQPTPLISDEALAPWRTRLPGLSDTVVGGANHYSLMLGDEGAGRIAAAVTGRDPGPPGPAR
ncbi:MAG: alpha/beta hydrolase [Acidobacteriota bacterium]|nr:alpha/beta hydrolase [Acidobacteriota bacterium]